MRARILLTYLSAVAFAHRCRAVEIDVWRVKVNAVVLTRSREKERQRQREATLAEIMINNTSK